MKKIAFTLLIMFITIPVYSVESENIDVQEVTVAKPELKIYPEKVIQGEQIVIDINNLNSDNQKLSIKINDKTYPVINTTDKKLKSYIPISPEMKAGGYTAKVINENNEIISEAKFEVKTGRFGVQNIGFYTPKLSKVQLDKLKEEDALVEKVKAVFTNEQLWDSPFMLPVPHRVSDIYGTKRYLNGKYNGYHSGVDFASPMSFPVKAINNANVSLARYFSKYNSNGNLVFLNHGIGVGSVYLHLSKIVVKEGEYVKKGQTIGYIGSSGRSTGPHIHWGVYLNGQNTDGLGWVNLSKKLF